MTYPYDLHIHSVLSPCADILMTPNNIFNMANLKGLKILSVTDHNSLKQLLVCEELSKSYDMLFIPGVEITVKEDFDVLCYFKYVEDALKVDKILERYVTKELYDVDKFGEQIICDINDDFIAYYPYLLSAPIDLSIYELIDLLKPFKHVMIYAHIDRDFRSGSAYINKLPLDGVEYRFKEVIHNTYSFYSSDAHQIIDIAEVTSKNQIALDEFSIDAFFRYFGHD